MTPTRAARTLTPSRRVWWPAAMLCTGVFVLGVAHAEDPPKPAREPAKASAKEDAKHLRFSRTYADALWEARLRNLPVFVSRHKDF